MPDNLRVCLYLEAESAVSKSGFRRAFESHQRALGVAGVEITTDPTDQPYDILHLHAFGPKSLFYLKQAKRAGARVVVHAHSVGAHDFRDSFTLSNWLAPLYEKYIGFVYAQGDAIFTPTPFAKRMLLQMGLEKPIYAISNGVDTQKFQFSEEARQRYRREYNLTRFTVFSAGLVIPRKGVAEFVELARRLPQFDFVWYGHRWPKAFAYHPQMDRLLRERPDNARLAGYAERPHEAFCAGDVLLFPSHTETQGMVLLEAAALGRPIVVRDLPEYKDWLFHNVNCLKASTTQEFADHLERLAQDRVLYNRLAAEAKALVVSDHSIERIGERLKALYGSLSAESEDLPRVAADLQRMG